MDEQNIMFLSGCVATMGPGVLPQAATFSDIYIDFERPSYKVEYVEDSTTDSIYTATSLLEKAIDDLDELSTLPVGWDSYGSPKISSDLIIAAKIFLSQLEHEFIAAPRVVPISGGGLQFEWQIDDRELELEFIDPDNIGYLKVRNDEPIEEDQFRLNDFRACQNVIQWLKGF